MNRLANATISILASFWDKNCFKTLRRDPGAPIDQNRARRSDHEKISNIELL